MTAAAIHISVHEQRGSASVIAVMLLVVLVLFLLTTATEMVTTGTIDTMLQEAASDALMVAESGVERAIRRFSDNTALCTGNNLGEVNVELVAGSGRRFTIVSDAVGLPANQCRLTVTGTVTASNAVRTLQVVSQAGSGGGVVAVDRVSSRQRGNRNDNIWNHRISNGGVDRFLVVAVSVRNGAAAAVTGVTYDSVPMQFLRRETTPNPNNDTFVEVWYQINPNIGNHPVVVNFNAAVESVGGSIGFTGVKPAAPEAVNGVKANSSNPAVAVTTVSNNAWVVAALAARTNANPVVGGGQTVRWNQVATNGGSVVRGAGSTFGPKTPAGLVTMNWTLGSSYWAMVGLAIAPSGSASPQLLSWREIVP